MTTEGYECNLLVDEFSAENTENNLRDGGIPYYHSATRFWQNKRKPSIMVIETVIWSFALLIGLLSAVQAFLTIFPSSAIRPVALIWLDATLNLCGILLLLTLLTVRVAVTRLQANGRDMSENGRVGIVVVTFLLVTLLSVSAAIRAEAEQVEGSHKGAITLSKISDIMLCAVLLLFSEAKAAVVSLTSHDRWMTRCFLTFVACLLAKQIIVVLSYVNTAFAGIGLYSAQISTLVCVACVGVYVASQPDSPVPSPGASHVPTCAEICLAVQCIGRAYKRRSGRWIGRFSALASDPMAFLMFLLPMCVLSLTVASQIVSAFLLPIVPAYDFLLPMVAVIGIQGSHWLIQQYTAPVSQGSTRLFAIDPLHKFCLATAMAFALLLVVMQTIAGFLVGVSGNSMTSVTFLVLALAPMEILLQFTFITTNHAYKHNPGQKLLLSVVSSFFLGVDVLWILRWVDVESLPLSLPKDWAIMLAISGAGMLAFRAICVAEIIAFLIHAIEPEHVAFRSRGLEIKAPCPELDSQEHKGLCTSAEPGTQAHLLATELISQSEKV